MSSTARGGIRNVSDYYITPQHHIEDFLHKFLSLEKQLTFDVRDGISLNQDLLILDPCAGGDEENDMSYPAVLFKFGANYNKIVTNDIREDSPADYHLDFLEATGEVEKYDMVITNPPFAIAQGIIEKSLEVCKPGGFVVMLLRLNYFGSRARKKFWELNMPKYAFVHHVRMGFTGDGKTDSIEYMHAVRQKGYNIESTQLYII